MNCFCHSRIGVRTLLAFIGVFSHCDNIPTQCKIDHQVRSSITLVTTIPNDIENMEEYFVVPWPEDAQTVSKECGNRIACVSVLLCVGNLARTLRRHLVLSHLVLGNRPLQSPFG